jgi:hypothetical protein
VNPEFLLSPLALVNAIFGAIGKRIRNLPMGDQLWVLKSILLPADVR